MKKQPSYITRAHDRLRKVMGILKSRGDERDLPGGERSMARAVRIFNAITDNQISTADGWRFMICLKLSRMQGGSFKEDDYDDLIGYAALLAEDAAEESAG